MTYIDNLRNELRRHDYLYYTLAKPEISDYKYDMLFKELEKMERDYPNLLTPDSPTQCVGGKSAKIYEESLKDE
jgi:DNA ligase (NAD+)